MAQSLDPHFQMHKQISVEDFVLDLLIILAEQIIYFDSNLCCLRVCTMHIDKCWQVLDLPGNRSNHVLHCINYQNENFTTLTPDFMFSPRTCQVSDITSELRLPHNSHWMGWCGLSVVAKLAEAITTCVIWIHHLIQFKLLHHTIFFASKVRLKIEFPKLVEEKNSEQYYTIMKTTMGLLGALLGTSSNLVSTAGFKWM